MSSCLCGPPQHHETFIPFHEARQIVLNHAGQADVERVPLSEALGRTLAEPIKSRDPIPPFDNAQMDGFAVRADDLAAPPVRLRVTSDVPAGVVPETDVRPGACARIMTGAPIPPGADAVVPVEWTKADGPDVRFGRAIDAGTYVRQAGEDVQPGAQIFVPGTVITPPVVGMLATLGYADVRARVPPRVAVIATGDELVEAAEAPGPGQIRNANGPALAAQVRTAGACPLLPDVARDTEKDTRRALENALQADVVVLSGGISMGERDVVQHVLRAMGAEILFWKVRQRPGKPLAFGLLDGRPIFALPGNPVSSAVGFEEYARPALAKRLGRASVLRPLYPATLAESVAKKPGLHHFVRGRATYAPDGALHVRPTGPQASNLYSSVVQADCLIHLPEAMADPQAGASVETEWLAW